MASCGCGNGHGSAPSKPENTGPMQSITAIINPDTKRGDEPQSVLLFQSLPNRTVGLEQFEFKSEVSLKEQKAGGVKGSYDATPVVPKLAYQSNLVSMVFDNLVHVYGVIKETGSICLLSPVTEPIPDSRVENAIIAGCSNGDNEGWLYYQQKINGKLFIVERSLENLDSTPIKVPNTGDSLENTQLAAFHDGTSRWIVYQTADDDGNPSVIRARCRDQEDTDVIEDSDQTTGGRAKHLTAVHAQGSQKQIYIYFTTAKNAVYRSVAPVKEGSLNFPKAERLATNLSIEGFASMAIAPAKNQNLIYTVPLGSKKITVGKDLWKA